MPITIIPADDTSGSNMGLQIFAQAMRDRAMRRAQQDRDYQALIAKAADPNTTEEEQAALLNQDPKKFERTYGVPLSTVGQDVERIRKVGASSGTGAPTATKGRVLVERPEGTPAGQQTAANLASTYANTAADEQHTQYYQQALGLNAQEAQLKEANTRAAVQQNFRTVDGKSPTNTQARGYLAGTYDLYPTNEATKRLESVRTILGGDSNDPAVKLAQLDLVNDHNIGIAQLDKLKADAEGQRAQTALMNERLSYFQRGIDPDTGKPLVGQQLDPREVTAVGKSFDEAFQSGLGTVGIPTQATAKMPWLPISLHSNSKQIVESPEIAGALFGGGSPDPAAVRADLLATTGGKGKLQTIDFPTIDKKTGMPVTTKLSVDAAVPVIAQMRRRWSVAMPPVFEALRQASPRALVEITQGNPLVYRMAQAYAPDVVKLIDGAREQVKAAQSPTAQQVDPRVAPFVDAIDKATREAAEYRKMLGTKVDNATGTGAVAPQ